MVDKQINGPITSFDGEYRFLSNFYISIIQFDGAFYDSVENAYQAAKTEIEAERAYIRAAKNSGEAKRRGKTVTLREDWEELKYDVMEDLVRRKFRGYLTLADKLIATYPRKLIERNQHGDTYWGVCKGKGENNLGRILEKVRKELKEERNQ